MIERLFSLFRPTLLSTAVLASLAIGCGDDGGVDEDLDAGPAGFVETIISTAGGTIELPNKGSVTIPAGALLVDKTIRIEVVDRSRIVDTPDRTRPVGDALALTPHGTQFEQPVRVRIETGGTTNRVRVYRLDDESDGTWKLVRGEEQSPDRSRVEVFVDKFSVYSAFEAETGGECGDRDDDDDGVGDFCDICDIGDDGVDSDADGIPDACDTCPLGAPHADAPVFGECDLSFTPFGDTYVEELVPDAMNFDSPELLVDSTPGDQKMSHMLFPLSDEIPFDSTVRDAELIVRANGLSTGPMDAVGVYEQGWFSEGMTTWNSGPTTGISLIETIANADIDATGELRTASTEFAQNIANQFSSSGEAYLTLQAAAGSAAFGSSTSASVSPPELRVTHQPFEILDIEPVEDTYVDPAQPAVNFGSEATLIVGADGTPDTNVRHLFLKFDLSSIPFCGATYAALELAVTDGESYGIGSVTATVITDDTWTEGTLDSTIASGLQTGAQLVLWRVSDPGRGDDQHRNYFNQDLLPIVSAEATGDSVLTLRLEITDAWHAYHSREATDLKLRPRLIVQYTPSCGG